MARAKAVKDEYIQVAVDDYLDYNENFKHLRPATISNQMHMLYPSVDRLAAHSIIRVSQLTSRTIERDVQEYSSTPSKSTGRPPADLAARGLMTTWKGWSRWAWKHGLFASEKFRDMSLPRADEPTVELFTDQHVDTMDLCITRFWDPQYHPEIALFRRTAAGRNRWCLRARLTWALGVSAGLRRGEMLGLLWRHWDPARCVLLVAKAKGRRQREVPAQLPLARLLNTWHEDGPRGGQGFEDGGDEQVDQGRGPDDLIICNDEGGPLDGGACLRQLQRYAAWGRAQGMDLPKITLHGARHKALNDILQVNPEHARLVAGHRNVNTTVKRYGHTTTEDVRHSQESSDVLSRIARKKATAQVQAEKEREKQIAKKKLF